MKRTGFMTMFLMACAAALAVSAGCAKEKTVFGPAISTANLPEPGRELAGARFNNGLGAWTLDNYRKLLAVETVGSGEDAALRLTNVTSERDTAWSLKSPVFDATPGREFAVVVFARGKVSMRAPFSKNALATHVAWLDAEGKPILAQDVDGKMRPSGLKFGFGSQGDAWIKTVVKGRFPENVRKSRVVLGCDAPDVAKDAYLEIRSVRVLEREDGGSWDFGDLEPPEIEPERMGPIADAQSPLRFRVDDASPLDRAAFTCVLDGKDVTADVRHVGGRLFEYAGASPLERGHVYILEVAAKDVYGNARKGSLPYWFGDAATKGLATVRDDGMTLLDGRPFFPIGIFSVRKGAFNGEDIDRAVRGLKDIGMNTLHRYMRRTVNGKDYEDFLDACDRHGMRAVVEPTLRKYNDKTHVDEQRDTLVAGARHPSLLAWCIGDDTASHRQPAEVLTDHRLCHAIDNARLTTQADIASYEGRYQAYAKATDTMILEVYPFRAETPEPDGLARLVRDVNHAITDKKRAGAENRGVWALVQAFDGWTLWKRFPTLAEIRAMSYLSVIHGCRGVLYYTYLSGSKKHGVASDPKQFETLAAVTKELASLKDDLCARDAKEQPAVAVLSGPAKDLCGFPSVTCLLKDGPSGRLLLAANSTTEPVKARIGVSAKGADVLFENRSVSAAGGIEDEFAPGAVHVYRLK